MIAESWVGVRIEGATSPRVVAERVAADALLDRWEAQLEHALGRLALLRRSLEDQAGRLGGLERELATPGHVPPAV